MTDYSEAGRGEPYFRDCVQRLADVMVQKLMQHRDRPGWDDNDPEWLLGRMTEEGRELAGAVKAWIEARYSRYATAEQIAAASRRVREEAADVANFCMMVAEVCHD